MKNSILTTFRQCVCLRQAAACAVLLLTSTPRYASGLPGDTTTQPGHSAAVYGTDTLELSKQVVSGSRILSLRSSAATFNRDEFVGKYTDLPSLLESVSGVNVRRTGGFGQYSETTIRGGAAHDVQVYLDGLPLNTASNAAVDISKLPLGSLESITVYKNTAPLELLGATMGGIVELRSDTGTRVASVNAETGSYGLLKAGALVGVPTGPLRHNAAFEYGHSDNDYPFLHDNGTTLRTLRNPDPTWDDTLLAKRNNFSTVARALYGTRWEQGEAQRAALQLSASTSEEGLFVYYYKNDQSGSIRNRSLAVNGTYGAATRGGLTLQTGASASLHTAEFIDPEGHFALGSFQRHSESRSPLLDMRVSVTIPAGSFLELQLVGSGTRESSTQRNLLAGNTALPPSMSRLTASAGSEVRLRRRNLAADLRACVRHEIDTASQVLSFDASQAYSDGTERTGIDVQGDVRFMLTPTLSVSSSLSRTSRSPSFFEKYGWGNSFVSEPSLVPEHRIEADAGIRFAGPWLQTMLCGFAGRIDDKIKTIPQGPSYSKILNFSDTRYVGAEWEMTLARPKWVRLTNRLTLMESLISGAGTAEWIGNREPFVSPVRNSTDIEMMVGSLSVGHSCMFESPYYRDGDNLDLWDEGKPVLSAFLSYTIRQHAMLRFRIENYLDVTNYDFRDNPNPGRAFVLSTVLSL